MDVRSYRDLKVWQVGVELVGQIYEITRSFPKSEVFGLTSQIQRAAVSVPSNIAEGHARGSRREFLHFLTISLGSLAELETQLLIGSRVGYLEAVILDGLLRQCDELGRMLRSLQRSLQSKA
ncbi:four helix bundle protein [Geomonas oryzisoli]|uniref:Four helix bundle protein n=1 Tax=Geomonas oryzisoli TaxID=2847992 RepID=A0ABX8J7S1_9BACT|nr:four helix bundle protein [Geomonas oryzisoli]QWV92757.1 four helix bundle protein [Geomonas oryzisoli]